MKAISEETKQRQNNRVTGFAMLVVMLYFTLMYDQGWRLADWKWFLSSESLAGKLDSGNTKVVEDVLDILEVRADPIGRERGVQLLESKDGDVWVLAASYLGKIKDQMATVPYTGDGASIEGLPGRSLDTASMDDWSGSRPEAGYLYDDGGEVFLKIFLA